MESTEPARHDSGSDPTREAPHPPLRRRRDGLRRGRARPPRRAELHARGDRVVVLASDTLGALTKNTPFQNILVPAGGLSNFDELVAKTARDVGADSIILSEVTLIYWRLMNQGTDATFVRSMPAPVIGLDAWNVRVTGLAWDVGGKTWNHSKHTFDVKHRLVPVPFSKPFGVTGLYDALPKPMAVSVEERDDLRADLGLGEADRLVVLTTGVWQHSGRLDGGARLGETLPALVDELVSRLGGRVHVVHVGPAAQAMPLLEDRYTWLSQRTPARFARLLAAADAFLGFNFTATSIWSSIVYGLPVLFAENSHAGTAEEIARALPEPPSAAVRAWLAKAAPVPTYRVWPVGLHGYLKPMTVDNPYCSAMRTVEILEERAFVDALHALLFDEAARVALREGQAAYCKTVGELPKAADLVHAFLRA